MKTLLLSFTLLTSTLYGQQTINASISHDGLQRDYILYVPANYTGMQDVPLLFNFHGYTSNASQQMLYGDFRAIADTAGFIIVHPEGKLDQSGQTHFNVGWGASSIDDLGFASALIDSLLVDYSIDTERVYSTGMSNGGFMSFHLACNLSDGIAAIASVTGSMVPQTMANCGASHATAIMQIHGTADGTVNYNGSAIGASIPDVLNHWVNYNNCNASAIVTNVPDINTSDNCTAEKSEYLNGDGCTEVVHYKINGGGHTWPGAPINIGITNKDINASVEIWKFLSQYSLNGKVGCSTPLGTDELVVENKLIVFPNPSNGVFTIKGAIEKNMHFQVCSILGEVLMDGNLKQDNIDLSDYNAGVYYFKSNKQVIKLVKE